MSSQSQAQLMDVILDRLAGKITPFMETCTDNEKAKIREVLTIVAKELGDFAIIAKAVEQQRPRSQVRVVATTHAEPKVDFMDKLINVCTLGALGKGIF